MHEPEHLGPEDVGHVVGVLDANVAGLGAVAQDPGDVVDAAGHALAEAQPDRLRDDARSSRAGRCMSDSAQSRNAG